MTCIGVGVANLWSGPEAPRAIDAPALECPVALEDWLAGLDDVTRLDLCDNKRLVTQALLDTPVEIIDRATDSYGRSWSRVVVPSQPTSLDSRGYPGWLPTEQLAKASGCREADCVRVSAPIAWLQGLPKGKTCKLSFMTRLTPATPCLDGDRVWVETALGHGWLARDRVQLPEESFTADADTLERLGRRFEGLRYLWAGISAFGFDCSGLIHSLFAAIDIWLPRDAHDQVESGEPVALDALHAGDLLFFTPAADITDVDISDIDISDIDISDVENEIQLGARTQTTRETRIDHVALYLGEDHILHSPTNNARIECRRLSGSHYQARLCAARRLLGGA